MSKKGRYKNRNEKCSSDEEDKESLTDLKKANPLNSTTSKDSGVTQLTDDFKKLCLKCSAVKTTLTEPTYNCFIEAFHEKGFRKIITIVGAGISTSAGIPDFRTPNEGIYYNLGKYNLPQAQAIFEIDYFMENPSAFYDLAKKLISREHKPTISHYFVKLLEKKGILLRHYTQNIDGLERRAGISEERLIESHGTFQTAHCIKCQTVYSFEWVKQEMAATNVPTCVTCDAVVKPDIVFFGENLPQKFYEHTAKDFNEADLLIIMGSTLLVEPFGSLVRKVDKHCPRVIINNQEIGKKVGIKYDPRINKRDIFIRGPCDEGCMKIIKSMGWTNQFEELTNDDDNGRREHEASSSKSRSNIDF